MKKIIIPVVAWAVAMCAPAQSDTTVIDRIRLAGDERGMLLPLAWQNPAVKQWQHSVSVSEVAVSWGYRDENQPLNTALGDRESVLAFDADTYMKHRTSTLWGHAEYQNGRRHGIGWNETSDLDVVYPYRLADSVSTAAMRSEQYGFMGGYADCRGRLAWGGTVGYKAGLHYRNVDPRPKNVTADLDVAAGLGLRCGQYVAAASLAFKKYKQTNNVSFFSELGSDKLFHLTGLAGDYGRFAGTGYNTYYKGYRWSGMLSLHPASGHGFSAAAQLSRFAFDNVLTGLNKLPMAAVTHNALAAEAGYIGRQWGVSAHLGASRRVGTENIFGDPEAQVYRQIAALDNYHENRFSASIDGVWRHDGRQWALALLPTLAYNHVNTIMADPQEQWQVNDLTLGLRARATAGIGRTLTQVMLGGQWAHPTDCTLNLTDTKDELTGLQRAVERDFTFASHNRLLVSASVSVNIPLNADYALRAAIGWTHGRYTAHNHTHCLNTALAFIF